MWRPDHLPKLAWAALILSTGLLLLTGGFWAARLLAAQNSQAIPTAQPASDPITGFPLNGRPTPDFTLTNQFGQPVALSSLRGREVVLAFIDSRCTTICPLTAQIMYDARARLKASAASQVTLVAVNANPAATSIAEVQSWSIKHGMLHQWLFLTGRPQQLQAVYHQFGVYDKVTSAGVVHDPLLYIIDGKGREQLYFETLDSNDPVDLNSQIAGLQIGMQQWLPQPH